MITRTSHSERADGPGAVARFASVAIALAGLLAAPLAFAADTNGAATPPAGKVNINQASIEQISYLPRIGAKVAARVVDYRKTHGQFSRAEDLMEVKGIGEKLFLTLKPYVAVSGPTTLAAKVRLGSSPSRKREAASPADAKPPSKSAPASVPAGKGR